MAKVLAIGAHPDDIEFYAGGTLAKRANQGDEVVFVVATDGGNGASSRTKLKHLAEVRRKEQALSAKMIGAKKVVYFGYKDGDLENKLKKLKKDLLRILHTERPDVIFTFDPQKQYVVHDDFHPDHRSLAISVMDVVLIDSTLPAKVIKPLKVPEVFLYNSYVVNKRIDISDSIEIKMAALGVHKSQMTTLRSYSISFEEFQVYTCKWNSKQ